MKDNPKEPSEEFRDAVRDGGTMCATDCGFCGRVHFVSGSGHGDYSEGELEDLKAKAKAEPDRYIQEGVYDCIPTGYFAGMNVVVYCKCNGLRRYEEWIWSHRDIILDYLKARTQKELDATRAVHRKVSDVVLVNVSLGRVLNNVIELVKTELQNEPKP